MRPSMLYYAARGGHSCISLYYISYTVFRRLGMPRHETAGRPCHAKIRNAVIVYTHDLTLPTQSHESYVRPPVTSMI
jgi:hypothetical protein